MASGPSRPLLPRSRSSTDHDRIYLPTYPYRALPSPTPVASIAPLDRAFPSTRNGQLLHYVEEFYLHKDFYVLLVGPQYEDLLESNNAPPVKFAPPVSSKKQCGLVNTWSPNLQVL